MHCGTGRPGGLYYVALLTASRVSCSVWHVSAVWAAMVGSSAVADICFWPGVRFCAWHSLVLYFFSSSGTQFGLNGGPRPLA